MDSCLAALPFVSKAFNTSSHREAHTTYLNSHCRVGTGWILEEKHYPITAARAKVMHVAHASLSPTPQSIAILIPKGNTNHYSIFFPFFHNGEDGQSSWCWNIRLLAQSSL